MIRQAAAKKRHAPDEPPTRGPSGVFRMKVLLARASGGNFLVCVFCKTIEDYTLGQVTDYVCPACGWHQADVQSTWTDRYLEGYIREIAR